VAVVDEWSSGGLEWWSARESNCRIGFQPVALSTARRIETTRILWTARSSEEKRPDRPETGWKPILHCFPARSQALRASLRSRRPSGTFRNTLWLAHSATPELLQLLNSFFKEYLPPLPAYFPLPLEEQRGETFDSSNARHECK